MSTLLPHGFTVRLADDVIVLEQGGLLVGGAPVVRMRIRDPRCRPDRQGRLVVSDRRSALVAERLVAADLALPEVASVPVPPGSELTVVVPVLDRARELDRCLDALGGLACLIVDDASRDPDAIQSVARRHGAQVIRLTENQGPAAARNAGLARVRSPYVAFVDSDVEVRGEDLLALLRHFADPAVAVVGPRVIGRSRRKRPRWFERYESRASSLTHGRRGGVVRPGARVAWLPSACMVARTKALGDGFDPDLRVAEDVDLVWRLADRGLRVRYDAGVEALHRTRPTVARWLARKVVYGTGAAVLAARHKDRVAPAVLTPTAALAGAGLLCRHRLALPLAAIAVLRTRRALGEVLPGDAGGRAAANVLATRGLMEAVRQESALLLRHCWPAAALGALVSSRVRRALGTALVVDLVVALRKDGAPLADLPAHVAARRLDDLAYGAGVWIGAIKARDLRAVTPRWISAGSPQRSSGTRVR